MIKIKKMQLVFFSLIPAGIILLIISINSVRKTFSGDIILNLPYLQKSSQFVLTGQANYSIWHQGQFFRKAPLDEFKPEITNRWNGQKIRLIPSLLRPNANNGKSARMELYRFTAPAGEYVLELKEGSSVSPVENNIISLIPAKKVDYDKYFIQVRESQPRILAFIGIFLIGLAAICIISGLVLGILADQIFKN